MSPALLFGAALAAALLAGERPAAAAEPAVLDAPAGWQPAPGALVYLRIVAEPMTLRTAGGPVVTEFACAAGGTPAATVLVTWAGLQRADAALLLRHEAAHCVGGFRHDRDAGAWDPR